VKVGNNTLENSNQRNVILNAVKTIGDDLTKEAILKSYNWICTNQGLEHLVPETSFLNSLDQICIISQQLNSSVIYERLQKNGILGNEADNNTFVYQLPATFGYQLPAMDVGKLVDNEDSLLDTMDIIQEVAVKGTDNTKNTTQTKNSNKSLQGMVKVKSETKYPYQWWQFTGIKVIIDKSFEDSTLAGKEGVIENFKDEKCLVSLEDNIMGEAYQIEYQYLKPAIPKKKSTVQVTKGELFGMSGLLIGIDEPDGLVRLDGEKGITFIPMVSLAQIL